ncbi:MAG: hypothetical protein U0175_06780 [Caldilineaceae bacterium]
MQQFPVLRTSQWHEEEGSESIEWIALLAVLLILLLAVTPVFGNGGSQIGSEIVSATGKYVAAWTGGTLRGGSSATTSGSGTTAGKPADAALTASDNGSDGGGFLGFLGDLAGQTGGFLKGVVVDGAWGTVKSIVLMGRDGLVMLPGTGHAIDFFFPGIRQETLDKYGRMIEAIKDDPGGALYAMVEPMVTAWKDGEYGRAIGMGVFEVATIIVPESKVGELSKITKIDAILPDELAALLARIDRATPDELGQIVRNTDKLSAEELAALQRRLAELSPEELRVVQRQVAEGLIAADGKFADSALEDAYQSYVQRKTAKGETPRDRADWKVERDYWLYDGPTARGNAFNRTANQNYEYSEVNLQTGKRVDAYDPVSGEIISRKATDFDTIQESTFRSYVNELKSKYPEGEIIRSNKYPQLDGQALQGRQILEVPASNMDSAVRAQFEAIAAEQGIAIRYVDEATGAIVYTTP